MIARPNLKLQVNNVVDRFFDTLGYERKKPPQLTRIVIVRIPESSTLVPAPARTQSQRTMPAPLPARRYRY
jgi:hypothetical protein